MGLLNRIRKPYVCQKSEVTKTETFEKTYETIEVLFTSGRKEVFENVDFVNHHFSSTIDVCTFDGVSFMSQVGFTPYEATQYREIGKLSPKQFDTIEGEISCEWGKNVIAEINPQHIEGKMYLDEETKKVAHTADVPVYEWVER